MFVYFIKHKVSASKLSASIDRNTVFIRIETTLFFLFFRFLLIQVPLGSIPELPAHSCQEIKAIEGKDTNSSKYWLDPAANGTAILVYCEMDLEGY